MQGVIIHYDGRIKRFLSGRENGARLGVLTVNPVPKSFETPPHPGERLPRDFWENPLRFIFTVDGRAFATSRKVSLTKGRRYPEVEHWFVLSDEPQHIPAVAADMSSVAPAV
jgi:hypothetical protein